MTPSEAQNGFTVSPDVFKLHCSVHYSCTCLYFCSMNFKAGMASPSGPSYSGKHFFRLCWKRGFYAHIIGHPTWRGGGDQSPNVMNHRMVGYSRSNTRLLIAVSSRYRSDARGVRRIAHNHHISCRRGRSDYHSLNYTMGFIELSHFRHGTTQAPPASATTTSYRYRCLAFRQRMQGDVLSMFRSPPQAVPSLLSSLRTGLSCSGRRKLVFSQRWGYRRPP